MIGFMFMRSTKISAGGQISVPAVVRHRWGTTRVTLEDCGDSLVIRPAPADPIGALRGAFASSVEMTSDALRAAARADEVAAERPR